MPLIKVQSMVEFPQDLIGELSTIVAESIGKPEAYVMVCVSKADIMMGGTLGNAVFAEVKSIGGLSPVVNREITMKLSGLLNDHLGIPKERVYVNFAEVPAVDWGWDGTLFG